MGFRVRDKVCLSEITGLIRYKLSLSGNKLGLSLVKPGLSEINWVYLVINWVYHQIY